MGRRKLLGQQAELVISTTNQCLRLLIGPFVVECLRRGLHRFLEEIIIEFIKVCDVGHTKYIITQNTITMMRRE